MEYRYGMRLRGFSPGCQPKQGFIRREDAGRRYHDILVYSRKLTDEELNEYELDFLDSQIKQVKEIKAKGVTWFYQEFTDALGDSESFNLYDSDGDFVAEFETWLDLKFFINAPIKLDKIAQLFQ